MYPSLFTPDFGIVGRGFGLGWGVGVDWDLLGWLDGWDELDEMDRMDGVRWNGG